jgi:LysR family transcriptional regulator, carnitine catabolism transcriptional activator
MIDAVDHTSIELRGLRAVVAVEEEGSFRAAARALGYTQSAVSHQISLLEQALGTELFVRPGGSGTVGLTPAGTIVYRRARHTLGEMATLVADLAALENGEVPLVRIGTSQTITSELLPAALRALRDLRPDVEVSLHEMIADAPVYDQLAAGELDLAFVFNPKPDSRVISISLMDSPWVILTRHDSDLAAVDSPSFDLLNDRELIGWNLRWRSQQELERAWSARGIHPRVIFRTDDSLALQRLVAAGYGDACVDRLAAVGAVEPSLTWLEPKEILTPRTLAVCRSRQREPSHPTLILIDSLQSQFNS